MERSGHAKGPGRVVVECTEPEDTELLTELEAGIEDAVRAFRADIVGRWAREYAVRRKNGEPCDPDAATSESGPTPISRPPPRRAPKVATVPAPTATLPAGEGDDEAADGEGDSADDPLTDDERAA